MSSNNNSQYWVVMPGFNEEKYVSNVLKKIKSVTKNIVVVDDGSSDNFAELAKKYAPYVLSHKINLGKGAALKTGAEFVFDVLGGKAVVFIDSDDQHDPQELKLFFKELSLGKQVIFGVRELNRNMPRLKVFFNAFASILINLLFGKYIPDIPSGFKALTKSAYQKLKWQSSDYAVEMELAAKTAKYGLDFSVVPIKTIYHDLDRGMTPLDGAKMLLQIIYWRITL